MSDKKIADFVTSGVLKVQNGLPCGNWNDKGIGILHLRPFNVTGGGQIDFSNKKYIEINRNLKNYLLKYGDVIFNNTNSESLVGKTAYWTCTEESVLSNHMTILRVVEPEALSAQFLAFFLLFKWYQRYFETICQRHVNQASVGKDRLEALQLPPIELPEQKKIAHILSTVQRAIEEQERIIQTTTELKKALMQKLFTEGLRGEPQKETEIGLVPESWEVVRLGKYARVLNGYAFKSADYVPEGVRLIRISNVSTGFLIDKDDKYLPISYLREKSAFALGEGDMVLSLTRPIISEGMKYCFIEKRHLPALLNQRVGKFDITDSRLRKDYLFQIIFSPYFIGPLKYMAEGSNQPNVSPNRLESFQIPIPTDMEEQTEIAELLAGINQKMDLAKEKKDTLQDLFHTLLQELMTATTRVHDLDLSPLAAA